MSGRGREPTDRLELPHPLRELETLRQQVHQAASMLSILLRRPRISAGTAGVVMTSILGGLQPGRAGRACSVTYGAGYRARPAQTESKNVNIATTPALVDVPQSTSINTMLADRVARTGDGPLIERRETPTAPWVPVSAKRSTPTSSPWPADWWPAGCRSATAWPSCRAPATSGRSSTTPSGPPAVCPSPCTRPRLPTRSSGSSPTPGAAS